MRRKRFRLGYVCCIRRCRFLKFGIERTRLGSRFFFAPSLSILRRIVRREVRFAALFMRSLVDWIERNIEALHGKAAVL